MQDRPISAAYLERKLRAIVGVQGSNPLPQLHDVNGLVIVENDRPEWAKAGGEILMLGYVQVSPAAQFGNTRIRNPVGSGMLVVIDYVDVLATTAQFLQWSPGYATTDLATGNNTKSLRDTRFADAGTQTQSAAVMSGQVSAGSTAVGQPSHETNNTAGVATVFPQPFVLGPGSSLDISTIAAVTATIVVNYAWRERPLEGTIEIK